MNNKLHSIVGAIIGLALLYFLVWPFINSAISHKYHLKTDTEGYPSSSYTSDFQKGYLGVSVANYNNVATEEKGEASEKNFYETTLDDETFDKLEKIVNNFKSFHLLARRHNGYGFYYDSTSGGAIFFSKEEKDDLLKFNRILLKLARGKEKNPEKRGQTYAQTGQKELKEFMDELDVE